MGGRGQTSPALGEQMIIQLPDEDHSLSRRRFPPPNLDDLPYAVVTSADDLGGRIYAFLEGLGRQWSVVSIKSDDMVDLDLHPSHTFEMTEPTIRWANDKGETRIYVDGMSYEDFSAQTGLVFHPEEKGSFVLSKRMSRLLRDYYVSDFFDEVAIDYMDLSPDEAKIWDGAGLVSRSMLEKIAIPADASPAKQAELRRELRHCDRVEFTIMSARGQDKGHAIVVDDLEGADFRLPVDTKGEVTLSEGYWVGFQFVHGKDHMKLDIQSNINLTSSETPFWSVEQLAEWQRDESILYLNAIESGEMSKLRGRIGRFTSLEDLQAYAPTEFFASEGDAMQSPYMIKQLAAARARRFELEDGKISLAIPGGRYYVMPAAVGNEGGLDIQVERGEIHIDHRRGTAWINDQDWLQLEDTNPDNPHGLAALWGGADHDDALWIHPIEDHDGQTKAVVWRSPNQLGEYAVLKPTANSDIPEWTRANGETITHIAADTRNLPARKDFIDIKNLGLVDPQTAGGLGEGHVYSPKLMDLAVARALENQGVLGSVCNAHMVSVAATGGLPQPLPCDLEDVIDANVKTGASLAHVRDWTMDFGIQLIKEQVPIPRSLLGRVTLPDKAYLTDKYGEEWMAQNGFKELGTRDIRRILRGKLKVAEDHPMDRLQQVVRDEARFIRAQAENLMRQPRISSRLIEAAKHDPPEMQRLGAEFNAKYNGWLNEVREARRQAGKPFLPEDKAEVARRAERWLARFPADQQRAILRGSIASITLRDPAGEKRNDGTIKPRTDAAAWLMGEKQPDGSYAPGIAQTTLEALREVGVVKCLDYDPEYGVFSYEGRHAVPNRTVQTVGMDYIWFNLAQARRQENGLPPYKGPSSLPKAEKESLKAQFAGLVSQERFDNYQLRVGTTGDGRLAAYGPDGHLFAMLSGSNLDVLGLAEGDEIQIEDIVLDTRADRARVPFIRLSPEADEEAPDQNQPRTRN